VSIITDPTSMDEEHTRHSRDSMKTDGAVETNLEDKLLQYDTEKLLGKQLFQKDQQFMRQNRAELIMNALNIWTGTSKKSDLWINAYHKRSIYRSKWKRDSLDIPQRNLKKKCGILNY
jgi:hypothetical protein